jgi:uncharacterized protein YukE
MKHLGQTDDPAELVPASYSALCRVSESYGELEKLLEHCAAALRKIRTNSWSGSSADAFGDTCARMTRHWLHLAGTYEEIRKDNARYAEALLWARDQAREAVALYDGDQSTRRAGHRVETRSDEQVREDHLKAREMLDDARSALGRDGDTATLAIDRANAIEETTGTAALAGPIVVVLPPEHTTIVSAHPPAAPAVPPATATAAPRDDGWVPLPPTAPAPAAAQPGARIV